MTIADLVTQAFRELGIAELVGDLPAELTGLGLTVTNRILNSWNAQHAAAYATRFDTFTLSPNTSPHTIGPTGATWTMTQRPVSIEDAALIIDGSPDTARPLSVIRRADEYASLSTPGLTSAYPQAVFYNPAWALGQLYFYPVPTVAHDVRLLSRVLLASVALTDTFTMPPGYEAALLHTLKEDLTRMPMFSSAASTEITRAAAEARAVAFGPALTPPRLQTRDAGLGDGRCGGEVYDYLVGPYR